MDNFLIAESEYSNLHGGGVPRFYGGTSTGVRWSVPATYPYPYGSVGYYPAQYGGATVVLDESVLESGAVSIKPKAEKPKVNTKEESAKNLKSMKNIDYGILTVGVLALAGIGYAVLKK